MKDYSLYYCDQRLEEAEVLELLKQAWDELYELEFDAVFGTWRGAHFGAGNGHGAHHLGKHVFGALYDLHSPGHPGHSAMTTPGMNFLNWNRPKSSASAACRGSGDKSARGRGPEPDRLGSAGQPPGPAVLRQNQDGGNESQQMSIDGYIDYQRREFCKDVQCPVQTGLWMVNHRARMVMKRYGRRVRPIAAILRINFTIG